MRRSWVDGRATAGTNYQATAGTLVFGAGETTKTLTIPIVDDHVSGAAKSFTMTLTAVGGGARLGMQSAQTVWIVPSE